MWTVTVVEGPYVGGFLDESCSARSGGSSRSLNPCCGEVCVNRMLRTAWVDMVGNRRQGLGSWTGDCWAGRRWESYLVRSK